MERREEVHHAVQPSEIDAALLENPLHLVPDQRELIVARDKVVLRVDVGEEVAAQRGRAIV